MLLHSSLCNFTNSLFHFLSALQVTIGCDRKCCTVHNWKYYTHQYQKYNFQNEIFFYWNKTKCVYKEYYSGYLYVSLSIYSYLTSYTIVGLTKKLKINGYIWFPKNTWFMTLKYVVWIRTKEQIHFHNSDVGTHILSRSVLYFFQTCLLLVVNVIGQRMDFYAMLHAFALIAVMYRRRRKAIAEIWPKYCCFLACMLTFQYFVCIGIPPAACKGTCGSLGQVV